MKGVIGWIGEVPAPEPLGPMNADDYVFRAGDYPDGGGIQFTIGEPAPPTFQDRLARPFQWLADRVRGYQLGDYE